MTNYYFDVDGVLANFHEHKDGWKYSKNYNFIRNLRPFVENIELVKSLIQAGENVFINSLVASETAKQARLDWLAEYLPKLHVDNIILIVGSGKKFEYMKTADGVLIDDKEANVKQWTKAGFKAVYLEEKGGKINLNKYYKIVKKTKKA